MVNAVLESFLQKPNVGCIGCHQYATVAPVGSQKPNIAASYSFMFKRASPGPN
jgi:cytochrome c551/c552